MYYSGLLLLGGTANVLWGLSVALVVIVATSVAMHFVNRLMATPPGEPVSQP